MKTLLWIAAGGLSVTTLCAEITRAFPAEWGKPPEIQTRDYVELPAGYGHGSSTLKQWIVAQLENESRRGALGVAPATLLYTNDFETAAIGAVPEDLMILGGEFMVRSDGTNRFFELPGAPLDSFAAQFGPATKDGVAVSARILGTAKGRRAPTFGVGLGGVSGWKLQVAPGKKTVELLKDQELKASVAGDWKSGTWTKVRLEISAGTGGVWRVAGKVWAAGTPEPSEATITCEEPEEPVAGKASILGSPFAGTPIAFDELKVERTK